MLSSKAIAFARKVADKIDTAVKNEVPPYPGAHSPEQHMQAIVAVFTMELAALYDRVLILEKHTASKE